LNKIKAQAQRQTGFSIFKAADITQCYFQHYHYHPIAGINGFRQL